jgi:hypothetical protein
MNCKECQHWDFNGESMVNSELPLSGKRRCCLAVRADPFLAETDDRLMVVMDGEDYMAELYTAPDFHCKGFDLR